MSFDDWKLKQPMSPSVPAPLPRQKPPCMWAQSSITFRPRACAISVMRSMSAMREPRCTGRMARVSGVIAASIFAASMHQVSGSMSTKTGLKPWTSAANAVA